MTPDELASYQQWQKTHRPGSAAKRAQARNDRKMAGQLAEHLSCEPVVSAEVAELQTEIDRLEAILAQNQVAAEVDIFG